jgi:hypothetical protein
MAGLQAPSQLNQFRGAGGGIGQVMSIIASEGNGVNGEANLINGVGGFSNGLPSDANWM